MAFNSSEYFRVKVEPALKEARSAQEMLDILEDFYNLDAPLRTMTHLAFRQGLRQAVAMLNPEPMYNVSDLNWAAQGGK